jgi:hypothetical protein
MPALTVFLVRSGETVDEVIVAKGIGKLRYHQKFDPPLTAKGYREAQDALRALVQGICDQTPIPPGRGDSDNDGVIDPLRNMACFSAPLKGCQSTAIMLSATGLDKQDKLTWRYTTVDAAKSPSAIPVLTVNELCAQQEEIVKCGGVDVVMDAGLLHTSAAPWNDARNKCPFMKVCVQDMKEVAGEYIKTWKEDRKAYPPRRVLAVQYLYISEVGDIWSLKELTPKVNLSVDMLPVNKYLPPPRKGNLSPKLNKGTAPPSIETFQVVSNCVWQARQVGCDTVFCFVPYSVMQCMIDTLGDGDSNVAQTACSVMTLTAHVNDAANDSSSGIDWQMLGVFSSAQVQQNPIAAVPPFPGPVECIVTPPEGKDPAVVPANQWSRFPFPEPENIPDDYPDLYVPKYCMELRCPSYDFVGPLTFAFRLLLIPNSRPPFSKALSVPFPNFSSGPSSRPTSVH